MKKKLFTLLFIFSAGFLLAQPVSGDYRTFQDGVWGNNPLYLPVFEVFNGTSWNEVDISSNPDNLTKTVTINHRIDIVDTEITINTGGQIVIAPGGKLTTGPELLYNNVGTGGILLQADGTGRGQLLNGSSISGTVQTYITGGKWHLIGSPVNGADANTVFLGFYMQQYDEASNKWIWNDSIAFNALMAKGKGYSVWKSANKTVTISGTLSIANVTVYNLTFLKDGFNLLANPYACGLKFTEGWTKANVGDNVYVWNSTTLNYITRDNTENFIIPPSQGFFMKASATGSVTMPSALRSVDDNIQVVDKTNGNIFKTTEVDEIKRVRLFIQNTANGYGDEIQFKFDPMASLNYNEQTDAAKMFGRAELPSPNLFFLTGDDIPVAIKGLEPTQASTLRMQLRPKADATYRITTMIYSFDPGTEILLEDLFTSQVMPVDANLSYEFTSTAADIEDRFLLYVTPATNSIDNPATENKFKVFGSYHQLRIITNESNYNLCVYNLLGQKLVEKSNLQGNASIDMNEFKQNIVLVSIQTENELISKKIQLK